MPEKQPTNQEPKQDNISKIYDVIATKDAPNVVGKPVFQKDMEMIKSLGVSTPAQLFGKYVSEDSEKAAIPMLNFGSKASTGCLPDDTRLRLFGLKKCLNNCEIQAGKMFRDKNPTADQVKQTPEYKARLAPMLKAFNISDFDTWYTTTQSRFFFEEYELPLLLSDKFDQLPMDSRLIRVPGALGLLEGELEDDEAVFTPQYNTKSSYTVEAKNNVVHTVVTQDLLDDSSPAIIDKIRKEVLMGTARSFNRAIISGDTTSPHMDSDIEATARHFSKGFKGLRKLAFENEITTGSANLVVYDHSDDTASKTLFATLLKMLGKFADDKNDLLWVYPSIIANDLITGAIPELFTAFAFGGLASNVTGQVPPVFGIQGIESSHCRDDLTSAGIYDGVTTTQTMMLLVKKSRFNVWVRQAVRVWAAPSLPSSDTLLMSAKARHAFAGVPQSATEISVVMAINIKKF